MSQPKIFGWMTESEYYALTTPSLRTRMCAPKPMQTRIVYAMERFVALFGFYPTSGELAELLGVSVPSITQALIRLENDGVCKRVGRGARSIRLVGSIERWTTVSQP